MNRITKGEGIRFLLDFWQKEYLEEFIREGGSKIKFLTGKEGCGKTYALNMLAKDGEKAGYQVISFSAKDVFLNDFSLIYAEIIRKTDILGCLKDCAKQIAMSISVNAKDIPDNRTAVDYLTSTGEMSVILRGEMRNFLNDFFLKNTQMDNSFAQVCALITASLLGLFPLDDESISLLTGWIYAKKEIKLSSLKPLGVSPARITKYNARHMLRSLCELIRLSGRSGILVLVDDLDIMMKKEGSENVRYTKMKRDDSYESIRQLIDDIDTMHNIMFVFAFDRAMIDNEKYGLKSYQALWMRIQNEIESGRFNCFTDIADLDRLARQEYSVDYLMEMSLEFAAEAEEKGMAAEVLSAEQIEEIQRQARFGTEGLPKLIKEHTLAPKGDVTHA